GSEAFKDNALLADVFIPSSVTTIGENAFTNIISEEATIVTEYEAKPASWHENWNGKVDNVSWGGILDYQLVSKTYHVVGRGSKKGSSITILNTYKKLPVTEIKTEAFKGDSNITSVTIGRNITSIGKSAFGAAAGSGTIASLSFAEGGTGALNIEQEAFVNQKLTALEMPSRIKLIGSSAFGAAVGSGTLGTLTFAEVNEQDISIGNSSFVNQKLTELMLPKKVKSIGSEAFKNNDSLESVFIPLDVISIGENAFTGIVTVEGTIVTDYETKPANWHENWNGKIDNVSWDGVLDYQLENGVYHVVGRGKKKGSIIIIPSTYKGLPVTEIKAETFKGDTNITSVHVGKNIKTIGNRAFEAGSYSSGTLTTLTFEKGSNTQELTIGDKAFAYQKIKTLEIPNRTTKIGNSAFDADVYNGTLTTLTFESGNDKGLTIGECAFSYQKIETLEIPNRVTEIGNNAFDATASKKFLTTLTFEKGSNTQELTIGDYAFAYQKIETLEIPNRTTKIGNHAFDGDSGKGTLTTLTFESGNDKGLTIGDYAFRYQKIVEVEIPKRTTSIGINAFYNNSLLAYVFIPSGVSTIKENAFTGIVTEEETIITGDLEKPAGWHENWNGKVGNVIWGGVFKYELVQGNVYHVAGRGSFVGETIIIPDTHRSLPVTEIKAEAFKDDGNITSVTIGKNVKVIGNSAFAAAAGSGTITSLNLVAGGTAEVFIRNEAFINQKLTALEIHDKVAYIGDSAFAAAAGSGTLETLTFAERSNRIDLVIKDRSFINQKLIELTLPLNTTDIGSEAFKNNSSLMYVFIPLGVMTVGENAFTGIVTEEGTIVSAFLGLTSGWHENWNGKVDNVVWGGLLDYQLIDDAYHVIGRGGKSGGDIIICATHKNRPITEIKASAFAGDTNVKSVTIGKNVKTIGNSAFAVSEGAGNLNELIFKSDGTNNTLTIGDKAFENQDIRGVEIPSGTTSIGEKAFSGNALLAAVFIPEGVLTIEDRAFAGIKTNPETIIALDLEKPAGWHENWNGKIGNVIWGGVLNYESVGNVYHVAGIGSFRGESIIIPDTYRSTRVTEIKAEAFKGENITSVTIGGNIAKIGKSAFAAERDRGTLKHLSFPGVRYSDGLTIEDYAFTNQDIGELIVPFNIQVIGADAFRYNKNLSSVYIPNGDSTIKEYAFADISKVSDTILAEYEEKPANWHENWNGKVNNVSWGSLEYELDENEVYLVKGRGTVKSSKIVIPSLHKGVSVRGVRARAFINDKNITSVKIGSTVQSIGEDAFSAESDSGTITSVVFEGYNEYVRIQIEDNAFRNQKITELIFPTNFGYIGKSAFAVAPGKGTLKRLVFEQDTDAVIADYAFAYQDLTELSIPRYITEIGACAFIATSGKPTLASLNFDPNRRSLKIGSSAFRYQNISVVEFVKDSGWLLDIGSNAFRDNASLSHVWIEGGNIKIGENAFTGIKTEKNTILTKYDRIPNSFHKDWNGGVDNVNWNKYFNFSIDKPSGLYGVYSRGAYSGSDFVINHRHSFEDVRVIRSQAFYDAFYASSVTLPHTMELIGDGAFKIGMPSSGGGNLHLLQKLTFTPGDKPLTIGNEAFSGHVLTTLEIPNNVTHIGERAFYSNRTDHATLTNLSFASGGSIPLTIGKAAFMDQPLTTLHLPSNLKEIGADAFSARVDGTLTSLSFASGGTDPLTIGKEAFSNSKITTLQLPSNLSEIGEKAFYNSKITTLDIPLNVEVIGAFAFSSDNSGSLTRVTFKDGSSRLEIGERAFANQKLETITIPDRDIYIGEAAFINNEKLSTVYVDSKKFASAVADNYRLYTYAKTVYVHKNITLDSSSYIAQKFVTNGVVSGNYVKYTHFTYDAIAAGKYHSLAVSSGGALYAWGNNRFNQLGLASSSNTKIPNLIAKDNAGASLPPFKSVASGSFHSLALTREGKLYTWGANSTGETGTGETADNIQAPTLVTKFYNQSAMISPTPTIVAISAGASYSLALASDGSVYSWGTNTYGQLGHGNSTTVTKPTKIAFFATKGKNIKFIEAALGHAFAIDSTGVLWSWGANSDYQLGNNTNTNSNIPVEIASGVTSVSGGRSHSFAFINGSVHSWGNDNRGQLGNGDVSDVVKTPTSIGHSDLKTMGAGNLEKSSIALSTNGQVYTWGLKFSEGSYEVHAVPTHISVPGSVKMVSGGEEHALVLTENGEIYAWGGNKEGQVGVNTTSGNVRNPTLVNEKNINP
ncbi:MAG: leucine-rich repeat protein, partial [Treponemataceae bacterium]